MLEGKEHCLTVQVFTWKARDVIHVIFHFALAFFFFEKVKGFEAVDFTQYDCQLIESDRYAMNTKGHYSMIISY